MNSNAKSYNQSSPVRTPLNRRGFLSGCAACTAYAATRPLFGFVPASIAAPDLFPTDKAKVRLVFSHIPNDRPTWPNIGYDYEARKKELTAKLTQECPDIQFEPITAMNAAEGKKLLENDKDVDGYLVYMLGIWAGAGREIAAAGRPVIFVDDLYAGSGEFLIEYSRARRQGLKVAGVSSSNFADVVQALKCFSALRKMRSSTVVDVTEKEKLWGDPLAIETVWGTKVHKIGQRELNEAYGRVDKAEAEKWAKNWIRGARKVVEPSHEEIIKSGGMYLAMQDLMKQNQAQALTIDCLTLFYGNQLPAYPCLGLFQFNNDGYVGACEGDLPSALSMLLMTYLTGRPGYISDPVIDTSKNQIIYAHCVSMNRVWGPQGKANPYDIRSHSEDRKGASVRSLLPLGEMTTTLLFNATRKEVVMHQARTVANVDEDKACRTKLAAEVRGDINKLLLEWDQWGWHRVTFFGDLKKPVEDIAALMGFKVVMEA
jgi:hypothetical protein